MMWRRSIEVGARRSLAIPLALVAIACGKDALVGGTCRQGLTECNLQCVDLVQDPANCGACGHACATGQSCSAAVCSRDLVDAALDTGEADAPFGDATFPDTPAVDVRSPDAPVCMPPFDTPDQCGDCDTKCVDPTPLCGLQGTFKCVARCDPPLVACGAVCVNLFSDEKNCGACGLVCASGICQAGVCVGKGYGHEVIIGTDYADATLSETSAQVTMLGNAILQSVASNVRVLAYDEFADPQTVARIEGWLSTMAMSRGKVVTITKAAGWSTIPEKLTVQQFQAFVVYDQALAADNQMATTGTLWNGAMNAFAKGGGIVVALDGGSVGQMADLLTNGGLLDVSGETDVTGMQLNIAAPTDVLGQNLPNVFVAKKSTVAFTTSKMRDNYNVFVVTDGTGLPVVVHSVPAP